MDILPHLTAKAVSLESLKKAIQSLKNTNNWDIECDEGYHALAFACSLQKYDVFHPLDILIQEGITLTMKILPYMVFYMSLECFKKETEYLINTEEWNSIFNDASRQIELEYNRQNYMIFDQVVQKVFALGWKRDRYVVNHVSMEFLKKLRQNLKDNDKWDSKDDDATKALVTAYSQQRYDVFALLDKEGCIFRVKNLPDIVENTRSLVSVTKAVQLLKETDQWDCKNLHAVRPLPIDYDQQKTDLSDVLVQEGHTVTMETFPVIILGPLSLDCLKNAIQHMKDTSKWNTKCDHSYRALELAYSGERCDAYDLLLQEGLTLTMMILPFVVYHVSLDHFKRVIQYLKNTEYWVYDLDDACRETEFAYKRQEYKLFDHLAQEVFRIVGKRIIFIAWDMSLGIVKQIIQYLKDTGKCNSMCGDASESIVAAYNQQRYDVCALWDKEGLILTVQNISDIVSNSLSVVSILKAIKHLKATHCWDSKSDDASQGLVIAYAQTKCNVCDLMVQEGIVLAIKNLSEVVANSISLEAVRNAIQHLKDTDNWNPMCDQASNALRIAYSQQAQDVFDLMVQEGLTLTINILPDIAANNVSLELLKNAIQNLKDTNNWDIKCDYASKAVTVAYCLQNYDILDLLDQEGLTLTMETLPNVIRYSKTLEYVKKAIQNLKGSGYWDCRVHDALKSLAIAYIQQKYDVCDLLVQEGLPVSMKILPLLVENVVRLKSIENAIQHLKGTANLDSKCDASKALAISHSLQNEDVFAIIVQEGLKLTKKNLPDIVRYSKSLKWVRKAIQHLKDTDSWDCNSHDALTAFVIAYFKKKYDVCAAFVREKALQDLKDTDIWDQKGDYASNAVEIAYKQHKHDVVDLLILEEGILTMKTLPCVVHYRSLDYVKKAIQHLKDGYIWDSTCDHSSQTLEILYIKQKYDIIDLLVEEKVKLTMKNLPNLAKSALLESLRKAMQYMKNTGNWAAKCDDASKAVEMNWKHRCDVCVLLLDEGVTLTMKNLRGVVVNSVSLDYFKEAIQHLKHTGVIMLRRH